MEPSRQEIKAWLQSILDQTGETPSALARRAGLATTTLTRFLNDPDAPMLGLRSIMKIAEAVGSSPHGALPIGSPPEPLPTSEAEPYREDADKTELRQAVAALVRELKLEPWTLHTDLLAAAGTLPGDILLVDPDREPLPGDIVRATLTTWSKKEEVIFRLYEQPYLLPAALDPRRRTPLLIEPDRVQITGTVRFVLRRA
jgi:transcriptional regulator with XRE-family HTH domain